MRILRRRTAALLVCAMVLVLGASVAGAAVSPADEVVKTAVQSGTIDVSFTTNLEPTASPTTLVWDVKPSDGVTKTTSSDGKTFTVTVNSQTSGIWTITDAANGTPTILKVKPVAPSTHTPPTSLALTSEVATISINSLLSDVCGTDANLAVVFPSAVLSNGTLYIDEKCTTKVNATTPGANDVFKKGKSVYFKRTNVSATSQEITYQVYDYKSNTEHVKADNATKVTISFTSSAASPDSFTIDTISGSSDQPLLFNATRANGVSQVEFGNPSYASGQDLKASTAITSLFSANVVNSTVSAAALTSAKFLTPSNDSGVVTISYTATLTAGGTKTGTITINVKPSAKDKHYDVPLGTGLTINSTSNDLHVDNHYSTKGVTFKVGDAALNIDATTTQGGKIRITNAESGYFIYTRPTYSGYYGSTTDTVRYTVTSNGLTNEGTITFDLVSSSYGSSNYQMEAWKNDDNRPEDLHKLSITSGSSNDLLRIRGLSSTDYSVDTSNFSVKWEKSGVDLDHTAVLASSNFTINSDGGFTFKPPEYQSGVAKLEYRYFPKNNTSAISYATVFIDVRPFALSPTYSATAGEELSLSSTDAKKTNLGSNLRASVVSNPLRGTLKLSPDGTFSYTPTAGYAGTDSFTYTLTDTVANLTSSTATVTFNVANSAVTPTPVATLAPASDVGIAVTGESDWLAYLLYAIGALALILGARYVFAAMRKMKGK